MTCDDCFHRPTRLLVTALDTDLDGWLATAPDFGVTITDSESVESRELCGDCEEVPDE